MSSLVRKACLAACGALLAAGATPPACAEPAPFMMRATVKGQLIEGQPLAWNQKTMLLMGRDGVLHEFAPADAKDASKTGRKFVGYTTAEMVAELRKQFNRDFDMTTTQHFVVVHPRGGWREWAERFETLFGSFSHYMSVRGFKIKEPATPLVAVIFRTEQEYFAHAESNGTPVNVGTLGHYDPVTNRVYMFNGSQDQVRVDWGANAETLIHEATHQSAYNLGIHRRLAEQPRWAVEGLAMMFEAPGVWDASAVRKPVDRLNRGQLDYFRSATDQRTPEWIIRLVTSDVTFKTDPLDAYSEAWMLTYYLCETRPQQYCAYLARVAAREPFTKYPPAERMRDFTASFGSGLAMLEAQLERYVEQLP